MAVLVTGGAGFIGTHTEVELINSGEDIVCVDNLCNSKEDALHTVEELTGKHIRFYKVDLLDRDALEQVFIENPDIDSVIHFAGLKAVGESCEKPLLYYHNNITGTLILCELMQKYGVKRIVFSSSATVYGSPESVPIPETAKLHTTNPYGSTKLYIEGILRDLCKADKDFSAVLLRYFNPVGSHPSHRIGENPNGIPNNLMPRIIYCAVGKMEKMTVFGNDYPTPDGTGVRDYIHVCDLAKGHVAALAYARTHTGSEAVNLGTGIGYGVFDMIHTFERVNGIEIPTVIMPRRDGDIASCYADTAKAEKLFGWKAEKNLEDMCRDAWEYAKSKL